MPAMPEKPATTPIPVQLSESEFTQFILPHLTMPKRGPRCKLGYHRVFNLIWLCRKFSFEAICGMISLHDQQYIMGELDDGDQFQRCPFPTGYHPDRCALVRGVSLKLSACGRTDGGARGVDRPRHHPALGREIQSPVVVSLRRADHAVA